MFWLFLTSHSYELLEFGSSDIAYAIVVANGDLLFYTAGLSLQTLHGHATAAFQQTLVLVSQCEGSMEWEYFNWLNYILLLLQNVSDRGVVF